jgi:hypothetical protein
LSAAGGEPDKVFDDDAIALLSNASGGVPRVLNRVASLAMELAASAESELVDVEAGLEALNRLELTPDDDNQEAAQSDGSTSAVLLPHPARTVEPTRSGRGKSADTVGGDEVTPIRGPKEKASRKRSV